MYAHMSTPLPSLDPPHQHNHDKHPRQVLAAVAHAAEERAATRALVLAIARGLSPGAKAAFFEQVRYVVMDGVCVWMDVYR